MSVEMPSGFAGKGVIARPVLAVEVAKALRELILEGELAGGEKIREKELTERFGVSRTPLREAMKMLSAEGLIELIPNRGAIISQTSEADLADAFPVLAALEALAGEQAVARAPDDELAAIAQLTNDLRTAFAAGDRHGYFAINQSIHDAIIAASRNPTLRKTHASLAGKVHRARYQANQAIGRWEQAVAEHVQISQALRDRDGERVSVLLRDHLMAKLDSVLA